MTEIAPAGNNWHRVIELERKDAMRALAEELANGLETMAGNETYQRAWRIAADWIRTGRYEKGKMVK